MKKIVGIVLSGFPVVVLVFAALLKLTASDAMVHAWAHLGFAPGLRVPIAVLDLGCVALYLVPRTAVLGGGW